MIVIIFSVIVGLILSYLVTEAGSTATIHLGSYIFNQVPLSAVIFISIVFGILLASFNTLKNIFQSKMMIFWQRRDLEKTNKVVDELSLKVDKLEEEKSELKTKLKGSVKVDK
ncbi:MAG TPA: hypothetical protein VLE91_04805 [Candidatus Saccharimonadales bacterium]|nr:hypothetical protein [Candidatus Saccharimonadales bacterium]